MLLVKNPQVNQGSALQPINPSHSPRTESPAKNQVQDLKRTRSPRLLPTYKDILQNSRTVVVRQEQYSFCSLSRPSVSPPRSTARRNPYTDPENHIWSPQYTDLDKPETPAINPSYIPVPKRSRLPFTPSNDPVLDDSERELQAKAKRLARFRDEKICVQVKLMEERNMKPLDLNLAALSARCSKDLELNLAKSLLCEIGQCTTAYPYNQLFGALVLKNYEMQDATLLSWNLMYIVD
ncbi:unnamed protein product [Lactuca saligna]|uniref:Uncharacterized protein n=1 Tax=Lactuca saligna TaxID=75948 RepID=A0AA36ECV6_LACSI|nr:unnamed protein product [Lactuca saligna]